MRILSIPPYERIATCTFAAVAARVDDSPLLPRLRHLSFTRRMLAPELRVHTLLSPTLSRLDITLDPWSFLHMGESPEEEDSGELWTVMNYVTSTCHDLQRLSIGGTFVRALASDLLGLHRLQDLDLSAQDFWKDSRGFCKIAQLPSLSSLRISVTGLDLTDSTTAGTCYFPSLSYLDIAGAPSAFDPVFRMISSPTLISLRMCSYHEQPWMEWDRCLATVTRSFTASLRRLVLKSFSDLGDDPALPVDDLPLLVGRLAQLPHLQEVCIDSARKLLVADRDMQALAASWPALRRLHFWCGQQKTRPSLSTLLAFRTRCPELISLAIPLEGYISAEEAANLAKLEAKPHGLQQLYLLGNVPIDDNLSVSTYISRLFPVLKHLEVGTWDMDHSWRWSRVREALNATSSASVSESSQWDDWKGNVDTN